MKSVLGGVKYSDLNVENTHHTAMHYNLMLEGVGAVLIADTHARAAALRSEDVVYFVPDSRDARRTLYLISRGGMGASPLAEDFKRLAVEICSKKENGGI